MFVLHKVIQQPNGTQTTITYDKRGREYYEGIDIRAERDLHEQLLVTHARANVLMKIISSESADVIREVFQLLRDGTLLANGTWIKSQDNHSN